MRPMILIENDGPIGYTTKVLFLPEGKPGEPDPDPVDISACITAVDVRIRMRDANTATLQAIKVGMAIRSELEEFVEHDLRPRVRRFRRVREGRRRLFDVTVLGDLWQRWTVR